MTKPNSKSKGSTEGSGASRRNFLKGSSMLVAGGAVLNQLSIARAAHSFGDSTLKFGLIGCGGRGTGAAHDVLTSPGATKLVAVADAFENNIQACLRGLNREFPEKLDVAKERQFVGFDAYKQVLEADIDFVLLATPPGFRPMHFEAAVKAGKHVFMEKPVAVDAPGVRRVLAANQIAKEKQLAVQVGLQRRHEERYKETIKRLQDGMIGDIILARAYWNGGGLWVRPRTKDQTELEYQMRNWYYFNWLCGDHIVEQHIHNLDVINWLMNAYPVSAQGQGGREVRRGLDYGQIYDHHFVEFTYANGTKMLSQCRHMDNCWNAVSEFAHGTKGSSVISNAQIKDASGKDIWTYGDGGGNGWQQEQHDFCAALRRGDIPNEGDYGAMSSMTSILGRLATYSGQNISMEDALKSTIHEADTDSMHVMSDKAPILPDSEGRYPVAVPGVTKVIELPSSPQA